MQLPMKALKELIEHIRYPGLRLYCAGVIAAGSLVRLRRPLLSS
jgi:hypothetical protein